MAVVACTVGASGVCVWACRVVALKHALRGGPAAVACHQRHRHRTAISTPMGMESENTRAASSRGFGIPEYVEVTSVVTIRARFGASDHIWRLIVRVTSACFSRWREK